jgi:hypothetical protein
MKKRFISFISAILMLVSLVVVPSAENNSEIGFLGYVDYDMDGIPEKVTFDKDIEIRDSNDKILFKIPLVFAGERPIPLDVEGEYRKTVLWHVEKTENGDVNFNVSIDGYNKRYTVSNGKAELSGESSSPGSYETMPIDMNNENIVYAFGALSKGDKGLSESAAKTNFEKLQKQAEELKKNSSGGFLAMLNIRDGKTQIIGKRAGESILYINGEAFEMYGVPDEIVYVNVAEDNSVGSYYGKYAAVFDLNFEEKENNSVPIYVSLDNRLIMPFSEEVVPDRYYINRDGDEMFEYGAVPISEETFLTIDGTKEILEEIEADGNITDNFLFREIEDGFIAEVNVIKYSEDGESSDRSHYSIPVDFELREDNSRSWLVSGDYTRKDSGISASYFDGWDIYPVVYPEILPTDFVFDVKSSTPIAKMRAIIHKENVDFLGLFDYDMDGTPEVVVREGDTKIYSEKGKLLFTFPAPKTDIVVWYVFENGEGEIIGSVEGYDYIIKKGKPEPYSGDGPENVLWLENIVYYTLGATDYDDADYASGKAKTEFYKLQSQAKYLEPEGWGNGYFAMLNIEHDKTQIVGISSNGDGIFVNGNLVPYGIDQRLNIHINPAFDSDPARREDSLILINTAWGGNTVHPDIPIFITDDDNIALPFGDYSDHIGHFLQVENGLISFSSFTMNYLTSGEYPNGWMPHAFTSEKYYFYRKGDELIEYGAIDFPLEKFKKLTGSEAVLKKIADDEMTIEKIFYRGNNEVNINCTREEEGEIWCYYYTYSLNENYEIDLNSLAHENGKYYPSILEKEGIGIAEYPNRLPDIGEITLKTMLSDKTKEKILLWEYGDFDNNGEFEAFAVAGEERDSGEMNGTIYIVNSGGVTELDKNSYFEDVFTFTCDDETFICAVFYGVQKTRIWGVNDTSAFEPAISGIGIFFTIDENEDITLCPTTLDNFTYFGDVNGSVVRKPYYFFYDNGFKEYGGVPLTLDELKKIENAEKTVGEIEHEGGEITEILIRGNGIININYTIDDTDVENLKWNRTKTLKISDNTATEITGYDYEGVYEKAFLPEIAVFPDELKRGENE